MSMGGGNTTIKWGLIAGIVLSVGSLIYNGPQLLHLQVVGQPGDNLNPSTDLITITIVLLLVFGLGTLTVLFVAGLLAARETGLARSGAAAAILAAVTATTFQTFLSLLFSIDTPQATLDSLGVHDEALRQFVTASLIIYTLCSLVITTSLAAGIGALGGLIGRMLYDEEDEEVFDPALQAEYHYYSGYPPTAGYPPAGAYPPPGYSPPPGAYHPPTYSPPASDAPPAPPG